MQIFSTAPFIYLLSFFSSFMLLNVHRRYRGGGWGGVEYLCPLLVTVKNFTTACRSLLFYVPCQCQELHDYMQITIYPVSFASQCQELHDCMQITIYPMSFANVKNFTTSYRSLFIMRPLPVNVKNFIFSIRSSVLPMR